MRIATGFNLTFGHSAGQLRIKGLYGGGTIHALPRGAWGMRRNALTTRAAQS